MTHNSYDTVELLYCTIIYHELVHLFPRLVGRLYIGSGILYFNTLSNYNIIINDITIHGINTIRITGKSVEIKARHLTSLFDLGLSLLVALAYHMH
jgi:hypothetical protein